MLRAAELEKEFRDQGGDPRFITADGQTIMAEQWFWDYDLRVVKVNFATTNFGRYWDGWFDTVYEDGSRGSVMNASRLCLHHPTTGKRAWV